jgi:ribosomal protein L37AE/L43A
MISSADENYQVHLCQRCDSNPIFFRVRSEVIDVKVCVECGVKAASLGLTVTELSKESDLSPSGPSSESGKKSA